MPVGERLSKVYIDNQRPLFFLIAYFADQAAGDFCLSRGGTLPDIPELQHNPLAVLLRPYSIGCHFVQIEHNAVILAPMMISHTGQHRAWRRPYHRLEQKQKYRGQNRRLPQKMKHRKTPFCACPGKVRTDNKTKQGESPLLRLIHPAPLSLSPSAQLLSASRSVGKAACTACRPSRCHRTLTLPS